MEPEVLYDKLAGMTCGEIALFLESEGIRGHTQDESSCALAKVFQKYGAVYVTINDHVEWTKAWGEYDYDSSGWGERRELADEMKEFIERFDGGLYPKLTIPSSFCEDDDYCLQHDYSVDDV